MPWLKRLNLSLIPLLVSFVFLLLPKDQKLLLSLHSGRVILAPAHFVRRELAYLKNLKAERDELARRVVLLNLELSSLRADAGVGLKGKEGLPDIPLLMAAIIGRDQSLRSFLIIDKGKKDGVEENQPAVVAEGVVGKVLVAGDAISLIETFYSPHMRITTLNSRSNYLAMLATRDFALKLDYVTPDAPIAVGDTILTSGLGGVFPRGIKVGWIREITPTQELFLDVAVEPAVDILRIDTVYLITKRDKEKAKEMRRMEELLKELELKVPELIKMR